MSEKTQEDYALTSDLPPIHVVSQKGHVVGDKVLAICGVKWKVTATWDDLTPEYPICRDCVEVAVIALQEGSDKIANVLDAWVRLDSAVNRVLDALTEENTLTAVVAETNEYAAKRAEKAERKATIAEARALVNEADSKKKSKKKDKSEDRPPVAPDEE